MLRGIRAIVFLGGTIISQPTLWAPVPYNRPMDTLLADVRYGFRLVRNSPLFTLVAAGTLALGLGANTAMFSVVDAVVIRALPYDDPDRVIVLWEDNSKSGFAK